MHLDLQVDEDEYRWLTRFHEISHDPDAGGHDLPKSAISRLEELGALRNCGFGRHAVTRFGDAVLEAMKGNKSPEANPDGRA